MRTLLHLTLWTLMALVAVYAAVGEHGVLYDNPLACLGVGLIGLGLMMQAQRRTCPRPEPKPVPVPVHHD